MNDTLPPDRPAASVLQRPNMRASVTDTPPFDPAPFAHLLTLAGPDFAAELIARFLSDLEQVQIKLRSAFAVHDWPTLAAASHVLIALAGTAGATTLETAARQLNQAALEKDPAGLNAYQTSVMQGLADLIAFITQTAIQGQART